MTQNSNGFLIVGPFLEICGGILRSSGTSLQIQDSTLTDVVDVRAIITNSDPGNYPVPQSRKRKHQRKPTGPSPRPFAVRL